MTQVNPFICSIN